MRRPGSSPLRSEWKTGQTLPARRDSKHDRFPVLLSDTEATLRDRACFQSGRSRRGIVESYSRRSIRAIRSKQFVDVFPDPGFFVRQGTKVLLVDLPVSRDDVGCRIADVFAGAVDH